MNCTDASDVLLLMETFPPLDCARILLAFQCRRFEVNQHPVADVIPILRKSGQSASREEAVEEMKDCRPTVNP
ncbi:hypothetical protein DY000_02014415 [Brassica cretica]|uniref:Uncharacterized protein n=1 Tax=Brassica cretica TaxID=69181 RepID=A0ABQ7D4T2_BRACR|nr:hypothetical protein DY000_02014415 [Brassica cretica]